MDLTPFLLTLLSVCKGSSVQAVVTQEPSLTVIPGGTVTLTSSSSTGAVTSGHYPRWIQQKSGQSPRGLIFGTNNLISGVPAQFSGSLLGDKAALTLKGAQAEDEAHYYCVLWYSNVRHSENLQWRAETKTFSEPARSQLHRLLEGCKSPDSGLDMRCSYTLSCIIG